MNHVFPILCLRVPRYMEDGDIRLRPLRIFDGQVINSGIRDDDILRSGGLLKPISKSWISLWWWLKKTYVLSYCIEAGSDLIGFIGLYNLSRDRSAEISLAIFDKGKRGLGYGTRAFNLLARNLEKHPWQIRARVKADNHAAISFWSKLGFEEHSDLGDMKLMSIAMPGNKAREWKKKRTQSMKYKKVIIFFAISVILSGCVAFHARSISPAETASRFEARTLSPVYSMGL